MAKIFVTGSADGLGQLAARLLIGQGHEVTLHARNSGRAKEAMTANPGAKRVLVGDLSQTDDIRALADRANRCGRFDAIIHNAGVYGVPSSLIVNVNTLAPFLLTCLIEKPDRLIYLSSGDHLHGRPNLEALKAGGRGISYADSKLHDVLLAKAVARKFPHVFSNAVDPGWVPTKMGGPSAPDDLQEGFDTQAWLAVSNDPAALASGKYFYHKHETRHHREADDERIQDQFIDVCESITGVKF